VLGGNLRCGEEKRNRGRSKSLPWRDGESGPETTREKEGGTEGTADAGGGGGVEGKLIFGLGWYGGVGNRGFWGGTNKIARSMRNGGPTQPAALFSGGRWHSLSQSHY